jgi:hypothetical protein
MPRDASELARRLAREAEAVCRHYLSNGKREGRYWLVGDVQNTPGRSLFVRLCARLVEKNFGPRCTASFCRKTSSASFLQRTPIRGNGERCERHLVGCPPARRPYCGTGIAPTAF